MSRASISVLVFCAAGVWFGAYATEYAEHPTKKTMAGSWVSVTSNGDVSRLVLDDTGVGQYAYDLAPGDVRIYDVIMVTIDDYKVRIDAIARGTSETLTLRGHATGDSIWIEWSRKQKQRFQREATFDQSLHDLRLAMAGSDGDD